MRNPAQNKYPYDETLLGLDGLYQVLDNNSFLIKLDCIASTDSVITVGKEYVLFYTNTEPRIRMSDVILVDCYYFEKVIHLIVRDIRSKRVVTISQRLECPKSDCTWVLVDLDYFIKRMDARIIQNYCGCDNGKKKPNGEGKAKSADDLLEFNF